MCSYQITPTIETDRLILRRPRPEDAEPIATLLCDYDVVKNLSRAPWPYTLDDAYDYVAKVDTLDAAYDQPLSIVHRDHGLIGGAGFQTTDDSLFPEIGYWIARAHWGQGYATETAFAALNWAKAQWGKRAIASSHFADNAASARVLVKAGFLYTGDVLERPCLARGNATTPTRMMIWLA